MTKEVISRNKFINSFLNMDFLFVVNTSDATWPGTYHWDNYRENITEENYEEHLDRNNGKSKFGY